MSLYNSFCAEAEPALLSFTISLDVRLHPFKNSSQPVLLAKIDKRMPKHHTIITLVQIVFFLHFACPPLINVPPMTIFDNFGNNKKCYAQKNYEPYYFDTNHLSNEGSEQLSRIIINNFKN